MAAHKTLRYGHLMIMTDQVRRPPLPRPPPLPPFPYPTRASDLRPDPSPTLTHGLDPRPDPNPNPTQDHDGSHIKGLIINFIHCYWPALLKQHDFVREFVTPIVKVSKARQSLSFFTLKEYANWRLAQAAHPLALTPTLSLTLSLTLPLTLP